MRIQRIYVDTSVIGGYFDEEFAAWSQGLMQDFREGRFRPVFSEIVAAEIARAPKEIRELFASVASLPGAEILQPSDETVSLARAYLERGIVGPRYADDGAHIAIATCAEVDLLVSWNFKHIVHFEKIRSFNAVNLEHGYKPIQIFSPREVTHYGEIEDSSCGDDSENPRGAR